MAFKAGVPNVTIRLIAEVCAECATHFAIDERLDAVLRETGQSFYCPKGHSLSFKESELDRLRKEATLLRDSKRWALNRAEAAEQSLESEKLQHRATKGWLTRTKKRVANGVCPECNRHFANVDRHMHNKHPKYAE